MKKQLLSLVLALAMIMSLFAGMGITASATETIQNLKESGWVSRNGNTVTITPASGASYFVEVVYKNDHGDVEGYGNSNNGRYYVINPMMGMAGRPIATNTSDLNADVESANNALIFKGEPKTGSTTITVEEQCIIVIAQIDPTVKIDDYYGGNTGSVCYAIKGIYAEEMGVELMSADFAANAAQLPSVNAEDVIAETFRKLMVPDGVITSTNSGLYIRGMLVVKVTPENVAELIHPELIAIAEAGSLVGQDLIDALSKFMGFPLDWADLEVINPAYVVAETDVYGLMVMANIDAYSGQKASFNSNVAVTFNGTAIDADELILTKGYEVETYESLRFYVSLGQVGAPSEGGDDDQPGGTTPNTPTDGTIVELTNLASITGNTLTLNFEGGYYLADGGPISGPITAEVIAGFRDQFLGGIGSNIVDLSDNSITVDDIDEYMYKTVVAIDGGLITQNTEVTIDSDTNYVYFAFQIDPNNKRVNFDGGDATAYAVTGVGIVFVSNGEIVVSDQPGGTTPPADGPYEITLDVDDLVNAEAGVCFFPEGTFTGQPKGTLLNPSESVELDDNTDSAVVLVYAESGYVFEQFPVVTVNGTPIEGAFEDGEYIFNIPEFTGDTVIKVTGTAVAEGGEEGGTPELGSITIDAYYSEIFDKIEDGKTLPDLSRLLDMGAISAEVQDKNYELIRVYAVDAKWYRASKSDNYATVVEVEYDEVADTENNLYLMEVIVVSDPYMVDPNTFGLTSEGIHSGRDIYVNTNTSGWDYAIYEHQFFSLQTLEERNYFTVKFVPVSQGPDSPDGPVESDDVVVELGEDWITRSGNTVTINVPNGEKYMLGIIKHAEDEWNDAEYYSEYYNGFIGQQILTPDNWQYVYNDCTVGINGSEIEGDYVYVGVEELSTSNGTPIVLNITEDQSIFLFHVSNTPFLTDSTGYKMYAILGVHAEAYIYDANAPTTHEHSYTYTSNNNGTHNGACACGEAAIVNQACTYVGGKCDKCGYSEPVAPPAHQHFYKYTSNNNGTHSGACACGEAAVVTLPCTYVGGYCYKCGYAESVTPPAHEHSYTYTSNNDGTHNGTCECGEDAIVNEACTYFYGKCDKCGYSEPVAPPAHEHSYTYTANNNGTHNGACACGEDAIVNEACAYVDGKCNKCGYSEPVSPPTVDIPVSNGDNTVDAEAEVSGNDAIINPLDEEQIKQLIANDKDSSGDIVIDLSKLDEKIDTAGIPKSTLEAIVNAAEDADNKTEHLVIKLSTAELKLDDTTMRAIVDQANGDIIKFNFDDVGLDRMNETQKDAVKDMDVRKGYEAYITVNNERIGDFKGGEVEIIVPYEVPEGEEVAAFSVWYVSEDGTLEKQESTYDGKNKWFVVSHFSDYVIVYSAEEVHDFTGDWKQDANEHWNECECGEEANRAAHADENNDGKCDVCDYQMATSTPDDTGDETSDTFENPEDSENTNNDSSSTSDKEGGCRGGIGIIVIIVIIIIGVIVYIILKKGNNDKNKAEKAKK